MPLGTIKHSSKSMMFNDTVANIGAGNIEDAVKMLDSRLDVIETNPTTSSGNLTAVGWKDNIVSIYPSRNNASTSPLWTDLGNGIEACVFSDAKTQSITLHYHINHDHKINTPIYPHIHWVPLSISTGKVVWEIQYVLAKGFGQNESLTGTPITRTLIQAAKGLHGEHMVVEVEDIDAITGVSEPDMILSISLKRLGSDVRDTFVGSVAALFLDLHYQSDMDHTPKKRPDYRSLA